MSGANQADKRSYDSGASSDAQSNFNRVAGRLEALIAQRSKDVKAAMSQYEAQNVSASYHDKEVRFETCANNVLGIIRTLQGSLGKVDASAAEAMRKAQAAVDAIG